MYIKGTHRTLASLKVCATIRSVNCGHSVINETQNNRYTSISNSITTVKSLRAQWTHWYQDIWSEAELCFYLMTLSTIHAVQLHRIALVHGELWKTRDKSLHNWTKVLSMYKTWCSNSSYWTFELHRMCHYVLKQVLYMMPIQCLNVWGKVVKEDWLFLVLHDPEDKTKHFSATSATTQPTAPCHVLHDSTNGMVPHEANSQPMPVPHPK